MRVEARRRRAVMLCSPWLKRSQSSSLVDDFEVEKGEMGRNRGSDSGVVIVIVSSSA